MAVNRREPLELPGSAPVNARWPAVQPREVVLAYDADPLDTLYVQFGREPRPGCYVPVELGESSTPGLLVKVSLDDAVILGLMVEGYLAWADHRHLAWLRVAPFAGVPHEAVSQREWVMGELAGRENAVSDLLADARAAWDVFVRAETE